MRYRKVEQVLRLENKDNEIIIPKVKYYMTSKMIPQTVFNGDITPFPTVMLDYLKETEIKILSIILRQHRRMGTCVMSLKKMSQVLGLSSVSVATSIKNLQRMGVIYYLNIGRTRNKCIDFDVIQKLWECTKDWRMGGVWELRKLAGESYIPDISTFTIMQVAARYSTLDDMEDPVESEEYN